MPIPSLWARYVWSGSRCSGRHGCVRTVPYPLRIPPCPHCLSTPGGWSQVISEKVGANNILAVDILEMDPLHNVKFIQQDFLAPEAPEIILSHMNNEKYDVVMSDMAANTTGDKKLDHLRTMGLVENALDFSLKVLKTGGSFVAKIFQGGAEKELLDRLKQNFDIVKHFKPKSSRKDSVEMYVVAKNFRSN